MTRVAGHGSNVAEVEAPSGRLYRRDRQGMFNMTESDARAMVASGGFLPSMAGTTRAGLGYRCPSCGHGSFFKTCGKCNTECEKE